MSTEHDEVKRSGFPQLITTLSSNFPAIPTPTLNLPHSQSPPVSISPTPNLSHSQSPTDQLPFKLPLVTNFLSCRLEMSAHRSTTAWDAETTMNLFACLLNEITPGAFEIRAVTDRMHAMGYTCTQKAVTHQFAKLKQRNKPTSGTAKSGAAEAIPSTPTKAVQRQHKVTAGPAVAVQKVAGYTASRKRGAEQALSDDDSDFLPVAKKRYNRVIAPATPRKVCPVRLSLPPEMQRTEILSVTAVQLFPRS